MTGVPDPESMSVNFSHDPILVASVWITSVVRPPPPTAEAALKYVAGRRLICAFAGRLG